MAFSAARLGFESHVYKIFLIFSFARPVAAAWYSRPGPCCGRPSLGSIGRGTTGGYCLVQPTGEATAGRGQGTAGRGYGAAATWRGRLRSTRAVAWLAMVGPLRGTAGQGSRPRPQLAGGKTKYKGVECKGKTQICM
jgi:hypothetical protein